MAYDTDAIGVRLVRLERQIRILKEIAAAAAVLAVVLATVPRSQAQQAQQTGDVLRVRQLVVEDAEGRGRMVLGYLDAPGNTRRFGIRINDPRGAERFGVAYQESGSTVIGLDAPPGTGDDRNRERITLVADEKGGAHIHFLDRTTSVVSRMYLDDQNKVWMQFSDFRQTPPLIRRYGLTGEEVIQPKR